MAQKLNKIKDVIAYMALLGLAGMSGWLFYNILLYGKVTLHEPDKGMVILELITAIALMGLAVERFIKLRGK